MKKNTIIKAMLSVATTSALVLGCAPLAFGAPGVSGTDVFDNNTADTNVKVATSATQLAAEVPLNMTVVADVKGGALTGVPTTGYKITNKSYFKIKVETIKGAAAASSSWTYSDTALSASSNAALAINFALTPANGTATTVTSAGANTSNDTNWNIEAATTSAGTDLAIGVAGTTAPLTKSIGDTGEAAAKITYTIAAA